jgi:hypothetical protein
LLVTDPLRERAEAAAENLFANVLPGSYGMGCSCASCSNVRSTLRDALLAFARDEVRREVDLELGMLLNYCERKSGWANAYHFAKHIRERMKTLAALRQPRVTEG